MKACVLLLPRTVFILAAIVMTTLSPVDYQPSANASSYDYIWLDEFDSSFLHPLWSWVREDASHWSLTAAPGNLQITTQEGGLFADSNNQNNILIADAPVGDFQISTEVTFNPIENFQYAAIQVYQDDDNFIQLNWAYVVNGTKIDLDKEIDGTVTSSQVPAPLTSTIFLRIERLENVYTGYYSVNGSDWTQVGQHTASLTNPKVSLAAANNLSGVAEIPADFDWFKLEANFANFYLTNADTFSSTTLDSRWTWMNENPNTWSLTDNPGFMRLLSQNGGVGSENFLYQDIPFGDFSIGTHEIFAPTANYQIASMLIYQAQDNFIQLGRAFCSHPPPDCTNGSGIYFDFINGGTYLGNYATSVPEVGEAYLKIERLGNVYSAYYSGNSATWQLIGRHKPSTPFTPTFFGLTTAQDFSNLQTPADFDYFEESHNASVFLPLVLR